MRPVEVKKNVFWVGVLDWDERDFHNFETERGLTYNSYLIVDEKIALVDTVKHKFVGDMLRKICQIVDPSEIDYVIVNHVEPDHSSGLPDVMKVAKGQLSSVLSAGKMGFASTTTAPDGMSRLSSRAMN